jgi:hypothetical protein
MPGSSRADSTQVFDAAPTGFAMVSASHADRNVENEHVLPARGAATMVTSPSCSLAVLASSR